MHIKQIEVSDLKSNADQSRGLISFECEEGTVEMHCSVPKQGVKNPRLALISEALRQLACAPEFRTGRRHFSFSTSIADADPVLA